MSGTAPIAQTRGITSTQIGAIGESVVATRLVLFSKGRLAPFIPFADDDGIDLLIYDKSTKRVVPLQVKSRTKLDNEAAGTVQFDVQMSTFSEEAGSHLLAVLLDGAEIVCNWLIPMAELRRTARADRGKLRIVPSTKATSKDRFTPYREFEFALVVDRLVHNLNS